MNFRGAAKIFHTFAEGLADAARAQAGQADLIQWEVEGREFLETLTTSKSGAIVLTAHMGNYDIAATHFSEKFGRRFNMVRAPERNAEAQRQMEEQLRREESETFTVKYNTGSGDLLGVELVHALGKGEVVAIQGDRTLFETASMTVPWSDGERIRIPKGPFVLAMTTGVPIYPLFVIRNGFRNYRIVVKEPINVPARVPRAERSAVIEKSARKWLSVLRPVIEEHWDQWYVFEDAFERNRE